MYTPLSKLSAKLLLICHLCISEEGSSPRMEQVVQRMGRRARRRNKSVQDVKEMRTLCDGLVQCIVFVVCGFGYYPNKILPAVCDTHTVVNANAEPLKNLPDGGVIPGPIHLRWGEAVPICIFTPLRCQRSR